MATVAELLNTLNEVDVATEAVTAITQTKDEMIMLNQVQLSAGYDSEGYRLLQYRSKDYAASKHLQNPLPGIGNPDLILTGAFISSFDVKLSGYDILFNASDDKAPELLSKYGDDVLGLMHGQQRYYNEEVFYPVFARQIENKTGLKFK